MNKFKYHAKWKGYCLNWDPEKYRIWFYCPKCQLLGTIDQDQYNGKVSIQCGYEKCDFHETINLKELETKR